MVCKPVISTGAFPEIERRLGVSKPAGLQTRMTNRWNIPPDLEAEVRARDLRCVYCGVMFAFPSRSRGTTASWEHIINDESIITRENIALSCCACNASKGQKTLHAWMGSPYCQRLGITWETVASVVRDALRPKP